jgi:hypothetical protein
MTATIAVESGHFYMPDGSPFYDVPNKSRPGESRPATTRDALKAGAEPSVSTVLKAAAAPNLVRYFVNEALESAIRLERMPNESPEAFKARALLDSQEHGKQARERGTALHGALERHLLCQPFDEQYQPHVANVTAALALRGIDLMAGKPERSFCLPGQYGGKIDWSSDVAVLDFKGVDDSKLTGKLGYDDHIRQLAAYAHGLHLPRARLLNVFIGRQSGGVALREWTPAEAEQGLAEFLALLRFYRLSKGFPVDATVSTMTTARGAVTAKGTTETQSFTEAA